VARVAGSTACVSRHLTVSDVIRIRLVALSQKSASEMIILRGAMVRLMNSLFA